MEEKYLVNINWEGLIPFLCYYGPANNVELTKDQLDYIIEVLGRNVIEYLNEDDSSFVFQDLLDEDITVEEIDDIEEIEIPVLKRKK